MKLIELENQLNKLKIQIIITIIFIGLYFIFVKYIFQELSLFPSFVLSLLLGLLTLEFIKLMICIINIIRKSK